MLQDVEISSCLCLDSRKTRATFPSVSNSRFGGFRRLFFLPESDAYEFLFFFSLLFLFFHAPERSRQNFFICDSQAERSAAPVPPPAWLLRK